MIRRSTRHTGAHALTLALALLLASGCGNNGTGNTPSGDMGADMPTPDMPVVDMPADDMDVPDMDTPDQSVPDTQPPTVSIGSGMVASEEGVYTLTGEAMDNTGVVALRYTLNDGAPQTLPVGATFSQQLTLPADPTTIKVFAEDATGNVGEATIVVGFEPRQLIMPSFTVTTLSNNAMTPLRYEHLRFDASGTANPRNKTLTYTWDFGDGRLKADDTKPSTRHQYPTANTYTVRLTVRADDGEEAVAERMITVAELMPQGTATLIGRVTDDDSGPLAGVHVIDRDGVDLGVTDAQGRYQATIPRGIPVALRLYHSDYTEQVVRVQVDPSRDQQEVSATLKRRNDPIYLADAALGGEVIAPAGARFTFPPNSLVDEITGQPVTGTIAIITTPVDMSQGRASQAFPGTFDGVLDEGAIAPIASYGVVEVELLQDGRPVQIAPGAEVMLDIPVQSDPSSNTPIPFWSLDPLTGQWVEEGEGQVVLKGGSPFLETRVKHFSWWNADVLAAGYFTEATFSFTYADGSPFTPTDASARQPRLSVVTNSAPARPVNRRIELESGKHVFPDKLPMPLGRPALIEAITYDATADKLYYAIQSTSIMPNDPAPAVELPMAEVGGAQLSLLPLPPKTAPHTVTSTKPQDTQFFTVDLTPGEALELEVSGTGTNSVVIRSQDGEVLLEHAVYNVAADGVIFAPNAPGRYIIQVRPETTSPGSTTIGADRLTPPPIAPGQNLSDALLQSTNTREFVITANKNEEVFSRVTDTSMSTWQVQLIAPNGRPLATLSTADGSSGPGTFKPIMAPNANGYRVRVSGSPSSGDGTGAFDVVLSDVERYSGRFTTNASKTITGFIGDPNTPNVPGKLHRYDFAAKPNHEVYVRLQRVEPGPTGALEPVPASTAVRLSVTGANLSQKHRFFDVATGATHIVSDVNSGNTITTGLIWVSMPNTETANYVLTVEQQPRDLQLNQITVGDCAGATTRAMALAISAIAPGGTIDLCETPDPHMPHEVLVGPNAFISIKGAPGLAATTRLDLVEQANLYMRGTVAPAPIALEHFTLVTNDTRSSSLISFNGEQAATLRDLHFTREGISDNGLSGITAMRFDMIGTALVPLTIEDVTLDAGFSDGVLLAGPVDATITNLQLGATTRQGVYYNSTLHASNISITDSALAMSATSGSAVFLVTNGLITIARNVIEHLNANSQYAYTIDATTNNGDAARHALTITDNALRTTGQDHGGVSITVRGGNEDVIFARNALVADNHTPGKVVYPLRLTTSSGAANLTARVENNALIGQTMPISLGNMQSFTSMLIQHNSVRLNQRTSTQPTSMLALTGASGSPQVLNNALAMNVPHDRPIAIADSGVTPVFTSNLIHNFTSTLYTPSISFTVTGERDLDPVWDPTSLIPMPGSPLLGAGAPSTLTDDLTGATRANPPSIGAYEAAVAP